MGQNISLQVYQTYDVLLYHFKNNPIWYDHYPALTQISFELLFMGKKYVKGGYDYKSSKHKYEYKYITI